MTVRLDAVRLGVAELDQATEAYAVLLGVAPVDREARVRRFQLARGAVELTTGPPGLDALRFLVDVLPATPLPDVVHGIPVRVEVAAPTAGDSAATPAIDHVVVQSPHPDPAIAVWRDIFGLRLALDREFAGRGLRLVFLRSGGITIEYASPVPAPATADDADRFYGLSYRVGDVAAERDRLLAAGLDVSAVRRGMRPGTSVASVRSGTCGVPTLLIEVHDRAGG